MTQQVIKRRPAAVTKKTDEGAFKTEGRFDFRPTCIEEAIQLAEIMADTAMVPDIYKGKPGDILVAMQLGDSVGLTPMQSIQGIAVINGRPAIWGDAALAVVLRSGLLENYKEMTFEEIKAAGKAVFWAKRRGIDEPIVREFSIEDAKRARLWNNSKKPIWQDYWPRMMQMRARGFGLRDGFADALKGIAIVEEMRDAIDITATEVAEAPKVLAVPRRLSDGSGVTVTGGKAKVERPASGDPEGNQGPDGEIRDQVPADGGETRAAIPSSGKIEPACGKCSGPMKFVEGGIARATGKPYDAFWKCEKDGYSIRDHEWKSKLQQLRFAETEQEPPAESREPGQDG